MPDPTPIGVLIAHQRKDISCCDCGWGDIGKSHCEHVLAELNLAGYVVVPIAYFQMNRTDGGPFRWRHHVSRLPPD